MQWLASMCTGHCCNWRIVFIQWPMRHVVLCKQQAHYNQKRCDRFIDNGHMPSCRSRASMCCGQASMFRLLPLMQLRDVTQYYLRAMHAAKTGMQSKRLCLTWQVKLVHSLALWQALSHEFEAAHGPHTLPVLLCRAVLAQCDCGKVLRKF